MWINHKDWYSNKEYKKAQDSWVWHYRNKLDKESLWGSPHVRFVKVSEYYREGRMCGRLQLMDFKQFERKLTKNSYNFYCDRKWVKYHTRNDGHKFQQRGYLKKTLTEHEQAKHEWREFKQLRKDKAKAYPYWRARKSSSVDPAWSALRAHVRDKIRKGDYEIDVDYKFDFSDPWDWR